MRYEIGKIMSASQRYFQKNWGYEFWTHNDEFYCSKVLHFNKANSSSSMHFHIEKVETFNIIKGKFKIKLILNAKESEFELLPGNWMDIYPGTPHQIIALEDDSEMIESSTTHKDEDSYRLWREIR